ncbi:hypothetical protein [Nonomuraea rubra]
MGRVDQALRGAQQGELRRTVATCRGGPPRLGSG